MFKNGLKHVVLISAIWMVSAIGYAEVVAKVKISGMVCPMCAHNIEKSFKAHFKDKTIKAFDVDMDEKVVTFEFAKSKGLSDSQITTGIKNAGYLVKGIERTSHE